MRGMHDYVIVGAGSAGCVLAARLSEDPNVSVTLIEAGGKGKHPNISIPAAFANQFHTKLDWDYATEPEPHCANRELYIPRGKGLGGSSNMNAMLYVRGRPLDYDQWAAMGATGWDWETIWPYFLKSEDNSRGKSEFHGAVVRAEREIILAAGAIGSPQLLLLSGIGPAGHLREVGVDVAHDLPGVGENLQDHPYLTCVWESTEPDSLYGADKPKPLLEWV